MSQVNLWTSAEHALWYLAKADSIPHRTEGEAVLLGEVPKNVKRILDVGTGDGRLLGLLKCNAKCSKCGDRLFAYNVGKSQNSFC